MRNIMTAIKMLLVMTVITGGIYTVLVTGIAELLFPTQSRGNIVYAGKKPVGSRLLAQRFESDAYFWSRPSASDYQALPSGASNLGPTSSDLKKKITERRAKLEKVMSTIPPELLFSSGSGLDPDISPEAALGQIQRVGKARNLAPTQIEELKNVVFRHVESPELGFLGMPRVNVLKLNLDVDRTFGKR